MNPDNPTFRTPEEERRAEEYIRVKEQNKIMREALDKIISLSGMGLTGISETIAFKDCGNIAREALEKAKRE